jgi:hypothetical protein
MSLQDDVNADVATIHAQIATAQAVSLPGSATINLAAVVNALNAAANAIDAQGGNSASLRTAIGQIQNPTVDLSQLNTAVSSHLSASAGMASLLIDQSNFDGSEQ